MEETGITAFGSVRLNHTRRMAAIDATPMELESSSRKHYTARQTLEQVMHSALVMAVLSSQQWSSPLAFGVE
jgi:hypothetical protein